MRTIFNARILKLKPLYDFYIVYVDKYFMHLCKIRDLFDFSHSSHSSARARNSILDE